MKTKKVFPLIAAAPFVGVAMAFTMNSNAFQDIDAYDLSGDYIGTFPAATDVCSQNTPDPCATAYPGIPNPPQNEDDRTDEGTPLLGDRVD